MALKPALKDRFFLFNLFEKPVFYEYDEFVKLYWVIEEYVVTIKSHVTGHLYRAVDPDAKFPWINMVVFSDEKAGPLGYPDEKFFSLVTTEVSAGTSRPGKYVEIDSYNGEELSLADKERPGSYRFLVTAVMADEDTVSCADLEKNWKAWMKADFIHDKLKDRAVDSLLYRQLSVALPTRPDVRYIVRTEIPDISDEEGTALAREVDKQANAKDVQTFTACYRVNINSRKGANEEEFAKVRAKRACSSSR